MKFLFVYSERMKIQECSEGTAEDKAVWPVCSRVLCCYLDPKKVGSFEGSFREFIFGERRVLVRSHFCL